VVLIAGNKMGGLLLIFSLVRILLFLGIASYFIRKSTKLPVSDRGLPLVIIAFFVFAIASTINLLTLISQQTDVSLVFGSARAAFALSVILYTIGAILLVYGLVLWNRTLADLYTETAKLTDLKQEIDAQNEIILGLSRDLEIRTTDYLTQREAALESDRSKTNFLRNTSHELRTPLNAIIGLSELLCDGHASTESQQKEFSGMIRDSGRKLLSIIDTLIEIARIKSDEYVPNMAPENIQNLINEVVAHNSPLADQKSIRFRQDKTDSDPIICLCDRRASHHILSKIIQNAIKFSPESNVIELSIQPQTGATVKITIKDHGPGIDPAFIDNSFEIFGRAERWQYRGQGGTGLGLALASKLAEIQEGKLEIESDGKSGTLCHLTLLHPDFQRSNVPAE
jgi:signal transduction histidine kinase